jgi:hypothetical protein
MSLSAHQSARSISTDWLTPPEWISKLGPFDLDPCASMNQPWPTAATMWTENGLEQPWTGLVWLNPPYGVPKIIEPWMARMAVSRNGVACIPARTETACWFRYVWPIAEVVLFTKGRPHFHKPVTGERAKANSGAPIALIGYGKKAASRLYASGIDGWMVKP